MRALRYSVWPYVAVGLIVVFVSSFLVDHRVSCDHMSLSHAKVIMCFVVDR